MIYGTLSVEKGKDGLIYFFSVYKMAYVNWKYQGGIVVDMKGAKIKVQLKNLREYRGKERELLYAFIDGKSNASVDVYRLD